MLVGRVVFQLDLYTVFTAVMRFLSRQFLPFLLNFKKLQNRNLNLIRKMSSFNEIDAANLAVSSDPAINPNASTFFDKLVSKEIPSQVSEIFLNDYSNFFLPSFLCLFVCLSLIDYL